MGNYSAKWNPMTKLEQYYADNPNMPRLNVHLVSQPEAEQRQRLCSVVCPTRARAHRCYNSVKSLLDSDHDKNDQIDILLRIDHDDPEYDEYRGLFSYLPPVKVYAGDRGRGYGDLWVYFQELCLLSDSFWIMQWNDDAIMSGPWISGLEQAPRQNRWCQCAVHKLGRSTYPKDDGAPFPAIPNGWWNLLPRDECFQGQRIPTAVDVGSINPLRPLGWKCHFLPNTSFHHQRDREVDLEKHRKL